MHPAIIIGTVRSLIVDVAMGQIPRSTERISSCNYCQVNYEFVSRYSPRILPQWMLRGPKNGPGLLIK